MPDFSSGLGALHICCRGKEMKKKWMDGCKYHNVQQQPSYFSDQGWLFPTFALRTNASINQDGCANGRHVCLPKTTSTTVTDKLHYLCLSAPNIWQTRHKKNGLNCPTEALKYFCGTGRGTASTPLRGHETFYLYPSFGGGSCLYIFLGKNDEDKILITGGRVHFFESCQNSFAGKQFCIFCVIYLLPILASKGLKSSTRNKRLCFMIRWRLWPEGSKWNNASTFFLFLTLATLSSRPAAQRGVGWQESSSNCFLKKKKEKKSLRPRKHLYTLCANASQQNPAKPRRDAWKLEKKKKKRTEKFVRKVPTGRKNKNKNQLYLK